MTAVQFFEEKHGVHCHTLPKQSIIDLMEAYYIKKTNFEKARDKFNSERFVNQINFEEQRKRLKDQNKNHQ